VPVQYCAGSRQRTHPILVQIEGGTPRPSGPVVAVGAGVSRSRQSEPTHVLAVHSRPRRPGPVGVVAELQRAPGVASGARSPRFGRGVRGQVVPAQNIAAHRSIPSCLHPGGPSTHRQARARCRHSPRCPRPRPVRSTSVVLTSSCTHPAPARAPASSIASCRPPPVRVSREETLAARELAAAELVGGGEQAPQLEVILARLAHGHQREALATRQCCS